MLKTPKNPKIEELTKSCTERSYHLGDIRPISVTVDSKLTRYCGWCAEVKLKHGNQKWCSQECIDSAMAWAYPQKEHGLNVLLVRQGWKCNICNYDWMPYVHKVVQRLPPYDKRDLGQFNWIIVKRLKNAVPKDRKPEVDHVTPIYKGGQSLGLENHQAICYLCHKTKTSSDLSGPRKKP